MPKTRYTTVNGMLIGERTDSGPRIDYVPDALGSIVAAVDENLNTTYTAAYKPYGDVLASTGTVPRFTWVGILGYLASAGVAYAEYSVRKRFPSSKSGRWTSVDALWPKQGAYAYVLASPVLLRDPSGLISDKPDCCDSLDSFDLVTTEINESVPPKFCGVSYSVYGYANQVDVYYSRRDTAPGEISGGGLLLIAWEKSNAPTPDNQVLNYWYPSSAYPGALQPQNYPPATCPGEGCWHDDDCPSVGAPISSKAKQLNFCFVWAVRDGCSGTWTTKFFNFAVIPGPAGGQVVPNGAYSYCQPLPEFH